MSGLFPEASGARFSACGRHRYALWRVWDERLPPAVFVMLNPSTADGANSDPTVERCQRRSVALGFGALRVVNLFALRSTDPGALYECDDPVGPENDVAIADAVLGAGIVICAWGTHGALNGRGDAVRAQLLNHGVQAACLGINGDGSPKHPLYVGYNVAPRAYL